MKKFLVLSFGFTLFVFSFTLVFAQSISGTELISNAKQYDGKEVLYSGEVIGEVMARGDYAWVNINDGENALGVWIDKKLISDIAYTGSYKNQGGRVQVSGIFHRACPEHGGDLDIHAEALKKLSAGYPIPHSLNQERKKIALQLLGALCLVLILKRLRRK